MQIHVRIGEPLAGRLRKESDRTGLTYSSVLRLALVEYLEEDDHA